MALGRSGNFLGAHEEIELTERFRRAGFEIWWVPKARIQHLVTLQHAIHLWHEQWRRAGVKVNPATGEFQSMNFSTNCGGKCEASQN
jgi:hypothetical protein